MFVGFFLLAFILNTKYFSWVLVNIVLSYSALKPHSKQLLHKLGQLYLSAIRVFRTILISYDKGAEETSSWQS